MGEGEGILRRLNVRRRSEAHGWRRWILRRSRFLQLAVALPSALAGCQRSGPPPDHVFRVTGMDRPASVVFDPLEQIFLVSNIGGRASAEDRNGFISAISRDGKQVKLRAHTTASVGVPLNAPRGMQILGDMLYVADLDRIIGIRLRTGKVGREIKVPGAKRLNDIALGEGILYVADEEDGAIYRIVPRQEMVDRLQLEGATTPAPNGMYVTDDGSLWIASGDGALLRVDSERSAEAFLEDERFADLTGLQEMRGGGLLVGSRKSGRVYRVEADGRIEEVISGLRAPGDFMLLGDLLVVPETKKNRVVAVRLPESTPASTSRPGQ